MPNRPRSLTAIAVATMFAVVSVGTYAPDDDGESRCEQYFAMGTDCYLSLGYELPEALLDGSSCEDSAEIRAGSEELQTFYDCWIGAFGSYICSSDLSREELDSALQEEAQDCIDAEGEHR